ncbi:hypothetical protein [Halonatronum saccharophilum]|uniref:hypothetical protein n=1 Tax=Halonatronum saccharophilum TaxID=150060 RepID=UPI0004B960F7|nr:hypothetical protein [Halonatronum saccharophilum]
MILISKTKKELFLELAQPDENGVSRWVDVSEFIGVYEPLTLGNGGSWCRRSTSLAKTYIIKKDKSITSGNSIDRLKLDGLREDGSGSQYINRQIQREIRKRRCAILGISEVEVDHKNGRKNDPRVMNSSTQRINDFQPLSKAANDAKRQYCKECKRSGKRFDAKELGYPISYIKGGVRHDGSPTGCEGCFWYDPIEFRYYLAKL